MILNNLNNLNNLIYAFIVSFIIFGIYVEVNPKMTNIWFRVNSEGIKTVQLDNLLMLMTGPLRYIFYWFPNYWDINYFIYLIIAFVIIEQINKKN